MIAANRIPTHASIGSGWRVIALRPPPSVAAASVAGPFSTISEIASLLALSFNLGEN